MDMMQSFKLMLVVMLFYSFSITAISYVLPGDSLDYVTSFSDMAGAYDLNATSTAIQGSLESQTNIPVIELGALVFYSGNILLDLLLNFAYAIPQMLSLVINGVFSLIHVDVALSGLLQLFTSIIWTILWFVGIIELVMNIRAGGVL